MFANFIPTKVEVKLGHLASAAALANGGAGPSNNYNQTRTMSVPIDNNGAHAYNNGMSNGKFNAPVAQPPAAHKTEKKKQNRNAFNKNTFSTPIDDPVMDEDFDFEKNLALFNKQAIWDEIDAIQKPDVVIDLQNKNCHSNRYFFKPFLVFHLMSGSTNDPFEKEREKLPAR